jgi:phospholipid-binding lipoprotein MlaA
VPQPLAFFRLAVGVAAASIALPALAQSPSPALIPDPWSGANHELYAINHTVDHAVIAPVIHAYIRVTPKVFRTGLSHAVDNLEEPRIAGNDLLQLHPARAGIAITRFILNSSFGLAGLVDVAATSGLPRHESDFGQTLARYGAPSGPYVFVPIAGPSDIRDGVGRLIDAFGDPLTAAFGGLGDTTFGNVRAGVTVVTARTDADDQLTGLDRDFTDPYAALRSAYSQNRAAMVASAKGETQATAVQDLPDFGAVPPPKP